jgi:uncharacterized protein YukE
MSMTHGADPDQLEQLAKVLSRQAATLRDSERALSAMVAGVAWQGPSATRFRSAWKGGHAAKLVLAATELGSASRELGIQAAQQRSASTAVGAAWSAGGQHGGKAGAEVHAFRVGTSGDFSVGGVTGKGSASAEALSARADAEAGVGFGNGLGELFQVTAGAGAAASLVSLNAKGSPPAPPMRAVASART